MRYLALCAILAVAGAVQAQAPKCWTNAAGVTECGTRPPPGVDARTVDVPKAANDVQAKVAEEFAEADLGAEEEQRRAIQLAHCELARETLAAYQRSDFLYERDVTGNKTILDEAETLRVKTEAEQAVATQCAEFNEPTP